MPFDWRIVRHVIANKSTIARWVTHRAFSCTREIGNGGPHARTRVCTRGRSSYSILYLCFGLVGYGTQKRYIFPYSTRACVITIISMCCGWLVMGLQQHDNPKPSYRHSFARFRCFSHKLHIEIGRYFGLESSQRICPHCHLDVETEIHFLLDCHLYNDRRNIMLAYMIDHYKGFETLTWQGRQASFWWTLPMKLFLFALPSTSFYLLL